MQITKIMLDIFVILIIVTSMSCNFLNKFVLHFVVRLIRMSVLIYQAANTLSQSHNQLQNKNINNINFFIFTLWQIQQLSCSG